MAHYFTRGKFTVIINDVREDFDLTNNEYVLLNTIVNFQALKSAKNPGYCDASVEYLAKSVGVDKRSIINMSAKLTSRGLIEKNPINGKLRANDEFTKAIFFGRETPQKFGELSSPNNNLKKKVQNEKSSPNFGEESSPTENKDNNKDSLLPPNPQISENVGQCSTNHVEGKHSVSFTMSNDDHVQPTMFNQNHVEFSNHVEGQIDRYGRPCENDVEGYSAPVSPANGEELTEEELNYYFGVSNEAAPVSQPAPVQTTTEAPTQTATQTKGARSRAQAAPAENPGGEGGYTFDDFWKQYNYPKGSKANAREKFKKLSAKDRQTIQKYLWVYLENTSTTGEEKGQAFKRMRKNPEFFLSPKAKCWETLEEEAAQLENAEPPLRKPFHNMTYEQYTGYYGELFPEITLLTPEQLRTVKYTIFHENEKDLTRDEYFELMKKAHRHVKVYEAQKFDLFKVLTNLIKLKGESKNPV